ncbi:MAG: hypothetical protein V4487_01815 [Chlamydiota bacterium]
MRLIKNDLIKASEKINLTSSQIETLWLELSSQSKFNLFHVLCYFGALIVILSMTFLFHFNGAPRSILIVSTFYAIVFLGSGAYFWHVKKFRIPGGLLFSLTIAMVPLITYSAQRILHWWPGNFPGEYEDFSFRIWAYGGWCVIEMSTLLVASLIFYFIRFPIISAMIYFLLWFVSMDLVPATLKQLEYTHASVVAGVVIAAIAFVLDRKKKADFAFWGYLLGTGMFWLGVTVIRFDADTEWLQFGYFSIDVILIALSLVLQRNIFLVFGALGVLIYLVHLMDRFFCHAFFSFTLAAVGSAIILLAVFLQYSQKKKQLN